MDGTIDFDAVRERHAEAALVEPKIATDDLDYDDLASLLTLAIVKLVGEDSELFEDKTI